MTLMKIDLENKIMIDHKTNLMYHPYFKLFEIHKLDLHYKKHKRTT